MLTSRHLGTITGDYTAAEVAEVPVDLNIDDLAAVSQAIVANFNRDRSLDHVSWES